ncbi:uncharacterized protein [Cherax quadricarinatus]
METKVMDGAAQPVWLLEAVYPIHDAKTETVYLNCVSHAGPELSESTSLGTSVGTSEATTFQPAPVNTLNGTFLSSGELYRLLSASSNEIVLRSVPKGLKENCYFLVDNKDNVKRRVVGRRSEFPDDCGVWEAKSASTTKTYYELVNENLLCVTMRNEKYCRLKQKKWVPVNPQPSHIVTLIRFYSKLKRDHSFQKRVTWLEGTDTAVWEYLGKFPTCVSYHGNTKNNFREYVRTDPKILSAIADKVHSKTPQQIYNDFLEEDSTNAPRDTKQIHSVKYKLLKASNTEGINKKNHMAYAHPVLNMLNKNPFVQYVTSGSGNPLSVILYTEDQIEDIKRFCCDCDETSVFGMDKTYDLGSCFLTLGVFNNRAVIRKSSGEHPVFLGPVYLHWNRSYETYFDFFSHLKSKQLNLGNLVLGSAEKTMVSAAVSCFPEADRILNTRHIEKNLRRHLNEKIDLSSSELKCVEDELLFSDDALIKCDDEFDFYRKSLDLELKYEQALPVLVPYFQNKLVPAMQRMIESRQRKTCLPKKWIKCCEAMKLVMKLIRMKHQNVPDMIGKLHTIVRLQYMDVRRALHDQGSCTISSDFQHHVISDILWASKTSEEKNQAYWKFMKSKIVVEKEK